MDEFDGIKERKEGKKKMPLGMAVLFLGLAAFALVYVYLFLPHTTGWTQTAQYEKQVKMQQALQAPSHKEAEGSESAVHERMEAMTRGEAVYKEACAVCHGEKFEGGLGPDLRGPKFLYGDSIEDHIRIISKGTANGMPGFEKQLGSTKIYNVAAYLHSRHKR
jgi:cytochrome c oxidase cbb3-type subunit 3